MNNFPLYAYHTHTTRCGHAEGTDREYIESAIRAGIKILGFSDHIPVPPSYIPEFQWIRMAYEMAEEYVNTVRSLKKEYADDIAIFVGYEGEYCADYYAEQMNYLKSFGFDYLLLGQHFVPYHEGFVLSPQPGSDPEILKSYVDTCIEGLRTGSYLYLAHPDIINFQGDGDVYNKEMLRLCSFCKENRIPLEINLHGLADSRHYPSNRFFRIAGEMQNDIVLGIDAHSPKEIGNLDNYRKAFDFVSSLNLKVLETLPIG
ncbi:MAG: histidinol-phosphatase [Oscillospiraceae bacterium]|nr:histidinol-phosphatase [Oscillospiraceae bacterium]